MDTPECSYFMFLEFTKGGDTDCFLLRACDTNSTSGCADQPDCQMAISGPVTPSLTDSCCREFQEVQCEDQYEVGHLFEVSGELACQRLCRHELSCSFWTLLGDECFLYSDCGTPELCNYCSSGSAFPDLTTCTSHQAHYTLLLGGDTSENNYTSTLEMITSSDVTCTPDMPDLPVGKQAASSTLLGSSIFHCGGFDGVAAWDYEGTCFSFLLGTESARWEEEESMKYPRWSFGLTTIEERLYATGGYNSWASYSSVESFSHETGWVIEDSMELVDFMGLPLPRYHHCSVALGSWLVVLGGRVGGSLESSTVQVFDTNTSDAGWFFLDSMNAARAGLACLTGDFEGRLGIFVSGGQQLDTEILSSVEFYSAEENTWQELGGMSTARSYHSLTFVSRQMVVAGGENEIASVETLDGTDWVETNNLKVGRDHHAALSIPATLLSCQMETPLKRILMSPNSVDNDRETGIF